MEGAFLLTGLLTGILDRLGEDVSGSGLSASDYMGVDAESDTRVRVAQTSRDDVNRDAREQQRGGVQVPQVMQPRVG